MAKLLLDRGKLGAKFWLIPVMETSWGATRLAAADDDTGSCLMFIIGNILGWEMRLLCVNKVAGLSPDTAGLFRPGWGGATTPPRDESELF